MKNNSKKYKKLSEIQPKIKIKSKWAKKIKWFTCPHCKKKTGVTSLKVTVENLK
jgi:transcription elongation factor Elf1